MVNTHVESQALGALDSHWQGKRGLATKYHDSTTLLMCIHAWLVACRIILHELVSTLNLCGPEDPILGIVDLFTYADGAPST
jgi:hypothetical protein